jgi:hypothetical protein
MAPLNQPRDDGLFKMSVDGSTSSFYNPVMVRGVNIYSEELVQRPINGKRSKQRKVDFS